MSTLKSPLGKASASDGKQTAAAAAAPAGKDPPKKICTVFEPQTWRKTMCKNCFKTREQHTAAASADSPSAPAAGDAQQPTSSSSSSASLDAACANNTPQPDTKPSRSTSALNEHSVKEAGGLNSQTPLPATATGGSGAADIKAAATKAVGSVKPTVQSGVSSGDSGATGPSTSAAATSASTSIVNGRGEHGVSESSVSNKQPSIDQQQQHATSHIPDRSRSHGVTNSSSSSSASSAAENSNSSFSSNSSARVAPVVSASTSSLTGQDQGQSSSEHTTKTTAASVAEAAVTEEAGEEESYYSRVIAEARKMLEEEEKQHSSSRQRPLVAALPAIPARPTTPRQPPVQAVVQPRSKDDSSTPSRSKDDNDATLNARRIRNARRGSRQEESEWRRAERARTSDLSRDEAMMEGTRMLIDNLKDKVTQLEDKCIRLDKEKMALNDLLALRKKEAEKIDDEWNEKVFELENDIRRLTNDKNRLINQIGVPEKDRGVVQRQEAELTVLQRRLEDLMNQYVDLEDENSDLKKEISDLQLEMDEMHDHYRDEEAGTFRALQRDLDVASKNCRILQVQVKKVERRNEQLEAEVKELEQRAAGGDGKPARTNNVGVDHTAAMKRLEDEVRQQVSEVARLQAALAATEKERDGLRLELTNEKKCVLKLDEERLTALQQYEALRKENSSKTEKLVEMESKALLIEDKLKTLEDTTKVKDKDKDEKKKQKEQTWKQEKQEMEAQVAALNLKVQELTALQAETKKAQKTLKKQKSIDKKEQEDEVKAAKELIATLTKEVDEWKSKANGKIASDNASATSAGTMDDRIKELNEALQQRDAIIKENKATLKTRKSELKDAKKQVESLEGELKKAQAALEAAESKSKAAAAGPPNADVLAKDSKQAQEALAKQREEVEKLNSTIAEKDKKCKKLEEDCKQAQSKLAQLESDKTKQGDVSTQLKEAKKSLTEKQNSIVELENKHKTELQTVKSELEVKTTKVKDLEKKLKDLTKEVDDTRLVVKEKEKLQQEKTKLEGELKLAKEKGPTPGLPSKVSALASKVDAKSGAVLAKEAVDKEKEALLKEKDGLVKEKETLKKDKDTLTVELEAMKKDHGALAKEKESLVQEKDRLTKELDKLKKESSAKMSALPATSALKAAKESEATAAKDKEALAKEKEQLSKDKASVQKEKDALALQRDEMNKEKTKLVKDGEALAAEKSAAAKDREEIVLSKKQIALEKEALTKQKDELLKEKDSITKEKNNLAKEKDKTTTNALLKSKVDPVAAKDAVSKSGTGVASKEQKVFEEQVGKLKQELESKSREWKTQKEDLEKKLAEGIKQLADKTAALSEFERQRSQQLTGALKGTPIPVIHQKTAGGGAGSSEQDKAEIAALKASLDQQEKQRADERRAYEESGRQLADVTLQVTMLKKQHADQSALLTSSRDTLANVKAKYDSSAATWTAEKDLLQKTICQLEDKLAKVSAADKEKEVLQAQLRDEEAKRMDLLAQLAAATAGKTPSTGDTKPVADASTPADTKLMAATGVKTLVAAKTKVTTPAPPPPGPGQLKATNTLGLKGKFEKPSDIKLAADKKSANAASPAAVTDGIKAKESDKPSADVATTVVNGEHAKLLEQTQQLLRDVQKKREDEVKDAAQRLQAKTNEWDKEREILQGKISLLEKRCNDASSCQGQVVELKCKLQENQENWQKEKHELERKIDEIRKKVTPDVNGYSSGESPTTPKVGSKSATPILVSHTTKQQTASPVPVTVKSPTTPTTPLSPASPAGGDIAASVNNEAEPCTSRLTGKCVHSLPLPSRSNATPPDVYVQEHRVSQLQQEVSTPNVTSFAEHANIAATSKVAQIFASNMCNDDNVFAVSRRDSSSSVDSVYSAADNDNDSVNSLLSTTAVSCTSTSASPTNVRHRLKPRVDKSGDSDWSPVSVSRCRQPHDWLLNEPRCSNDKIAEGELLTASLFPLPESASSCLAANVNYNSNDLNSHSLCRANETHLLMQPSSSATWPRQRVAVHVEHVTQPDDGDGRLHDNYSIIRTVAVGRTDLGERQHGSRQVSASMYDVAGYSGRGRDSDNIVSKSMDDVASGQLQASRLPSHRGPYPPAPPSMIISPRRFAFNSQYSN